MGWYYDFHIHDDEYEGNIASFGRGGIDEYEWRIDISNGREGEDYDMLCVRFTDEQARQLYEWLGKELMDGYRYMEKLAKDRYDEIERMRKDEGSRR